MIIHKPKKEIKGNKIRLSAYIEFETRKEFSETLWFEFDKEYSKYISKNSNGFVANMMLLAMYLKEDIKVKGKISPKLEYGLKQVQKYFSFWKVTDFQYGFPKKFHEIKIIPEGYTIEKTKGEGALCTFSGGVDSFYTLYKHLPENQPYPPHRITHCLNLNGFNKTLNDEVIKYYNLRLKRLKKMENRNNLKIISVTSNFQDFYKRYKAFSPCHYGVTLSSVALFLTPLVSRFYIASSYEYSTFKPEGSNPITDPMMSTETLEVIHYDCSKSRIDKAIAISQWEETYENLMVCFSEKEFNCCECDKCIRTMITLQLAGTLSKYKTFPNPLTRKKVRNWGEQNKTHYQEVLDYAIKVGHKKIIEDVKYSKKKKEKGSYPLLNKLWALIWKPSAYLKRKSRTYRQFVKIIKNGIK
ncbi:hypothetical protein KY334_02245 [Candidatus Woesearchaeota archaeon]|nr:hypothetical protein [Candidatus Woesearchaeota archaeon]